MCKRVALLAALWWALNPDDSGAWIAGVPVVALAAWAAAMLGASTRWSLRLAGLARFAPFFLFASLRGGADVAWRALHPRLPIEPALMCHPLRLPPGTARVFLVNVVSLLPGTLSADLRASNLVLHGLGDPTVTARGVAVLEERVAALFGVLLAEPRNRSS
jgi:multicomponent Na+:H+ antiporter subunit E